MSEYRDLDHSELPALLNKANARIAELEKKKHCSESYDTVCPPSICDCRNKTSAEPVAWMELYKGEPNNIDWHKDNLNYGSDLHDVIPLYTRPQDQADRIAELEKDLHMLERHNDQLDHDIYTVCLDCNKKVTGDSIHTCSPRAKPRLSDEDIEKVRVVIMGTAYWCADNGDSESYNAVKVMCSEVLAMLRGAK